MASRRSENLRDASVVGDFLILFDVAEIAQWTRHGQSTIRRWIACRRIPGCYLNRPGGKISMSGDQLARLIKSWQEAEVEPPTPAAANDAHQAS
jgi:hypothetical protein